MPPSNCTEPLVRSEAGQRACLALVRAAIARHWDPGYPLPNLPENPTACAFVSLHEHGVLRGCIGRLDHADQLNQLLPELAASCAFEDPRFAPLAKDELPRCDIEISLLGPRQSVPAHSREALMAALTPGDGLVLSRHGQKALFLPQVWDQLTAPDDFVNALFRKANWSTWPWPTELKASVFHCQLLAEPRKA